MKVLSKESINQKFIGALIPLVIHALSLIIFYSVIHWPGLKVPYMFGWTEDFIVYLCIFTFLPAIFGWYRFGTVFSASEWLGFYLGHFLGPLTYSEEIGGGNTGYAYLLFGIILGFILGVAYEMYSARKRKAITQN